MISCWKCPFCHHFTVVRLNPGLWALTLYLCHRCGAFWEKPPTSVRRTP